MSEKQYLGEGLYYQHDGYGVWLTAEDGKGVTNRVYLEHPNVIVTFLKALATDYPAEKLKAVIDGAQS